MLEQDAAIAGNGLERRNGLQPDGRILGTVIECSGASAIVSADVSAAQFADDWTVSGFLTISGPKSRIVGMLVKIELPNGIWSLDTPNRTYFKIELVGEVVDEDGAPRFSRGISAYPKIGAIAHKIRAADLEAVFHNSGSNSVIVGTLSQNSDIEATISIDEMLAKHFAVVGSTGVGKSSAVSLLLHKAISRRERLRVLVLDPHNEYTHAFGDLAVTLNADTLRLPFWLFKLDEFAEVLFRGRQRSQEEIDLLRELIPMARAQYKLSDSRLTLKRNVDVGNITADTPTPYRIEDLTRLIMDRMGQLDNKDERPALRQLRARLHAVTNDQRFAFMFGYRRVQDVFAEVMREIYRVPKSGKPITIVQMAGLPSEVVNSVASVLARLAFDMAMLSQGTYEVLVLCEEAHRYLPADEKLGFEPTRLSLAKIAKEGRKYGCYLGCVTQRPGELDPTILSQCSTIFAMRLSNEQDQAIIGSAIGDSSSSNLTFLPTMAQREAIVFGEGVSTPMRLRFEKLPDDLLPATQNIAERQVRTTSGDVELAKIITRMRAGLGGDSSLDGDDLDDIGSELDLVSYRAPVGTPSLAEDNPFDINRAPDGMSLRTGRRVTDPVYRPFADKD